MTISDSITQTPQTLGLRQYSSAIPDLYDVAVRGSHNGRIAAIIALFKMNHPDSRDALDQLSLVLDPEYLIYFR